MDMNPFRTLVRTEGVRLYRDLPWRRTRDPYEIWLSEVMLQQTQVSRVETRWSEWLDRFPSVFALAEAGTAEVLAAWQGMGYNRRALALKAAAEQVVSVYDGVFPTGVKELVSLPGIGPATAQGIRAFAYGLPGVYLETNVRTVVLHHLFPDVVSVPDKELVPVVEATCPAPPGPGTGRDLGEVHPEGPYAVPQDEEDDPRSWYYAMLDYGAYLKKTVPNPSRRSKAYARQTKFEGSRRQKRAEIVRQLLDAQKRGEGLGVSSIHASLCEVERRAGRPEVAVDLVASILSDLAREGFCVDSDGIWRIA